MKRNRNCLLCIFSILLLLSFTACGGGEVADDRTETLVTETSTEFPTLEMPFIALGEPVQLSQPPDIRFSYQYKSGGAVLGRTHFVQPAAFDWMVENENGVGKTTHVDAPRPCYNEKTQRISLEDLADHSYTMDIDLPSFLESYTLKAYSVGRYDDSATDCTMQEGKLELLRGAYYYELIIRYPQGTAIYGFFVE